MSVDPLRALLRGCKRTSASEAFKPSTGQPAEKRQQPATSRPRSGVPLAPELDFFGTPQPTAAPIAPIQTPSPTAEPSSPLDASFEALITHPNLRQSLTRLHITRPTPVQQRAIPPMLAHQDMVAIAPTGSGKTLAYLLPLLTHALQHELQVSHRPYSVILAPTRELAHQISRVLTRVIQTGSFKLRHILLTSRSSLTSLTSQTTVHVVIATPQTLVSALSDTPIDLSAVRHVVLDEADELLKEKFLPQVDTILASARARDDHGTRVHFFTATLPPNVDDLARTLLKRMKKVVVGGSAYGGSAAVNDISSTIEQSFQFVGGRGEQGKIFAVRALLQKGLKPPVLLFVQSKDRAAELFRELVYDGVQVDAIHSDRTQAARMSTVARFRAGKIWVLIATDLLARGLDFLCVNTVVNYDMPSSPLAYVHRIGRTGRNGRSGQAITLFTEEDKLVVGGIVKIARASGAVVPDWLVALGNKVRPDELKRLEVRPPARRRLGGPNRPSLVNAGRKKRRRTEASSEADDAEGDDDFEGDGRVGDSVSGGFGIADEPDNGIERDSEPAKKQTTRRRRRAKKKKTKN